MVNFAWYNYAKSQIQKYFDSLRITMDDSRPEMERPIVLVTSRTKAEKDIIEKCIRKGVDIDNDNAIAERITDIAGIRIVCRYRHNIAEIAEICRQMKDTIILREKNYLENPKNSGYSAMHVIVGVPVEHIDTIVPVEIQIMTINMYSWCVHDHGMNYKSINADDVVLANYRTQAQLVRMLDDKAEELYRYIKAKSPAT